MSGNYFDALGIQPYLGRLFHSSDEHGPNSAPCIVLAYAYCHSHFHDDQGVVGRIVQVNKHPFTIVGVAPQGFHGTLLFGSPDFFVPMVNVEQVEGTGILKVRGNHWIFMTMGHLRAGVTPEQAAADANAISASVERTYPRDHHHVTLILARPSLYGDLLGRPLRAFLTAFIRAADRSREVALRLALGAGRIRILRQLFTEALLISLIGGGSAYGAAWSCCAP